MSRKSIARIHGLRIDSRSIRPFPSGAAASAVMSQKLDRAMSKLFSIDVRSYETFLDRECPSFRLPMTLLFFCSFCFGCQSFQKRISQRSANCGALCAQAREAEERGNSDQASAYINEALRQNPSDFETRRQLAETMWNNGRHAEAVLEYSHLCAEQPKNAKLAARLAVMQWDANQPAAAARTAEWVSKMDPQSKEAWLIKARSEAATGQLDAALLSYIRLSQIAPDDVSVLVELGELHLKRGHPERACPLFRTALENSRTTADQRGQIEWQLGVAYARSERWSVALTVLESAMSHRNASAEDWCFLGSARLQCRDLIGAQSDLERALQCDPQSKAVRDLARELSALSQVGPSDDVITPASHEQNL